MRPYESEIHAIVDQIWTSMLGREVHPDDPAPPPSRDDAVSSHVEIAGAWRGSVTLRCEARLARQLAAALFAIHPAETSADQVADALGELANMTAGNFKAILPGPCALSPPRAGTPTTPRPGDPAATHPGGFGFRCDDMAFSITVAPTDPDRVVPDA